MPFDVVQRYRTMQNTEKGRKISNAAASTGRAVVQTGKAVGGVISQAKGALTSWWSTFHAADVDQHESAGQGDCAGVRMSEIDLGSSDGE